jgi:hypothetical protein
VEFPLFSIALAMGDGYRTMTVAEKDLRVDPKSIRTLRMKRVVFPGFGFREEP